MTHTAAAKPEPRASYRLQLNKDFTFADVERIAGCLGHLGVSHAYLSPILKARAGSTHGYDAVDHSQLNPELGTLDDFRRMAGRLKDEGIGIILDIVPNHMGVGGADNPYWLDLLEWGRDSRYASWFDVNWSPSEPSLRNKVLVPFLGCTFGEALETGRLALHFDQEDGSFAVWAEDTHKLPIDPRTYGDILSRGGKGLQQLAPQFEALPGPGDADWLKQELLPATAEIEAIVAFFNSPDGREDLAGLCDWQNWRAARHSVAADDINYRRFFIISDLAAIRVEQQDVFDHAHRLVFQLVEEGLIEGLRIDHIDGLYDPRQYTLRLRQQCPRPIYLVVEKILAPHEKLSADWNVDGTTGYEFANAVAQLLANPEAEQQLTDFYADFAGQTETLDAIERQAKLDIIDDEMAAELDALTIRLRDIAVTSRMTADLTSNGIRNGLRHLVASMPVYRSYVDGNGANDDDRRNVTVALGKARRMAPALDPAIFDFLERVATAGPDDDPAAIIEAAMRLQQFTGPVMAKGLEDTALYRYNRLIALSDVGERPDRFSAGVDSFHDFNRWRSQHEPLGMLTSSSHDTKRGEDVRARVAALTLIADEWVAAVQRWRDLLMRAGAPEIDGNDLYYLLQQLMGAWPTEFAGEVEIAAAALDIFRERSVAAMVKAVREARVHSTWSAPNEDYEGKVAAVLAILLDPDGVLFPDLRQFADRLGPLGARNSLVAATLKLTAPGMPDIYQGAELYEQSMVDPDNRRPVDFALRQQMLDAASATPMVTLEDWWTGAAKLGTIHRLLQLRRELPELFAKGSYEAIRLDSDRALAFLRRHEDEAVLVVAWLGLAEDVVEAPLELPGDLEGALWQPIVGGTAGTSPLDVRGVLGDLPVAVLRRVR